MAMIFTDVAKPSAGGLRLADALRRLLRAVARRLDRLVPACDPARPPEPPPEWFRYPPI